MKFIKMSVLTLALLNFASCMSDGQFKDKMTKIIKENPSVLTDAIAANPAEFVEAIQKAAKNAQEVLLREEKKKKKRN